MRMKACIVLGACAALWATAPRAQETAPGDALGACLTARITPDEGETIMLFVYAAMSKHPAFRAYASIPADKEEEIDRRAGAAVTSLLTSACPTETKAALGAGVGAFQAAFTPVGAGAMRRIMADPNVAHAMASLGAHLDLVKLNALVLEGAAPAAHAP